MCSIPTPSRDYYAAAEKDSKTTTGTTERGEGRCEYGHNLWLNYLKQCVQQAKSLEGYAPQWVVIRSSRGVFLLFHFQGFL